MDRIGLHKISQQTIPELVNGGRRKDLPGEALVLASCAFLRTGLSCSEVCCFNGGDIGNMADVFLGEDFDVLPPMFCVREGKSTMPEEYQRLASD